VDRGQPVFANHRLDSSHPFANDLSGKLEIGIRPEFVSFSDDGIPVAIDKVEDLGRYQVVTVRHETEQIKMVVGEDQAIPEHSPKIRFAADNLLLYRDDWAVETGHA
jgi:glycerol transport system ATP-binding protein